jgi:hypothetical protein
MHGRRFSQALDETFVTWLQSHEAVALHRSLQASCEILGRFPSLKDAVAFLRDSTNGDYGSKDALLRAFVEAYQTERRPHRSAQLLLGALQPGLSRLFHQHAGRWPGLEDAELWGLIVASFLEVVSSYRLSRRPDRIAKNLLMDTLRRTLRWLHGHHGHNAPPRPRRARADGTIDATEAMPFVQALVRGGIVNGGDAAILLATRIVGERLPVLAQKRGKSYEALRKRRQRAEQAIRRHLRAGTQQIAQRDGLAPDSVPLAEAVEDVLRDVPQTRDW